MWHALVHFMGVDSGLPYGSWSWGNWWSGFGGDLSFLGSVLLGAWQVYRKFNCHAHLCWRIGTHKVESTTFVVCWRHHPEIDECVKRRRRQRLTHAYIIKTYQERNGH